MSNKPWQQLTHEDDDTFAVFMLWLMMPPERDLTAAYGKHVGLEVDGVPTHLQDAYDRDDWAARAHAYDIAEERREMYWWENNRKVWKRTEFQVAAKIMRKAQEMLDWPIYRETVSEDGKTIIREPANWAVRDIAAMVRVASDIARLSVEMEKNVHKLVVTLSPEAVEAMEKLERFGITMDELMRLFERQVIDQQVRYELSASNED